MKIATFNVNGVNARLPALLRWLEERAPDIVCLQELKTPQELLHPHTKHDAENTTVWNGKKITN
jgi:exodeoxyribonuclease-3